MAKLYVFLLACVLMLSSCGPIKTIFDAGMIWAFFLVAIVIVIIVVIVAKAKK